MKRILHAMTTAMLFCGAFMFTSCGDDDITVDRDYTSVHYTVTPGIGLMKFYTIKAYYTDFNGVDHEEEVKDVTTWEYREKKEGTHKIQCRVVATVKSKEEYGEIDASAYDFNWEYSIHWYKKEGGAHSEQPITSPNYISKDNVPSYLEAHPAITLISFNK
ncbi:MAG: hypothetical protein IKT00_10220 [Prevotella sp.]|nr:hypothetical protein [Prevotella sp.]